MRKRSLSLCASVVAALAVLAGPAEAQDPIPVSAEVRAGVAFPTGDLSDAGAESGLALGADVFFGFFPRFSLYGGYAWHRFGCDVCVDDVTTSGPRGGVKVLLPLPGRAVPWIRGGLTWSGSDGLIGEADGELGLEFGGGLDYSVAPRLSLAPALHYKTFTQEFATTEVDVSHLTLELGAHFHF